MISMIIPLKIPSQNVTQRQHWALRSKQNKEWAAWIKAKSVGAVKATGKRKVTITSIRKRLIDDHANLVGGAKGMVDQLTNLGLIVDDCDSMAEIEYRQKTCKEYGGRECTIIEIEDVKDDK